MPLPDPRPGLIVNYAFLWHDEAGQGHLEGRKDRPCVVILAVQEIDGAKRVTVAPITHSPPTDPAGSAEIPAGTKRALGLDAARSWIVTSELNRFTWPGPDLRPISRDRPDVFAYGFLPPSLFRIVQAQVLRHMREGAMRVTGREE